MPHSAGLERELSQPQSVRLAFLLSTSVLIHRSLLEPDITRSILERIVADVDRFPYENSRLAKLALLKEIGDAIESGRHDAACTDTLNIHLQAVYEALGDMIDVLRGALYGHHGECQRCNDLAKRISDERVRIAQALEARE